MVVVGGLVVEGVCAGIADGASGLGCACRADGWRVIRDLSLDDGKDGYITSSVSISK